MGKNDAPTCFGKAEKCGKSPACEICLFTESCRFYVENPPPEENERSTTEHFVSFEHIAHDKSVASIQEEIPSNATNYDEPYFSRADMEAMLFFLLREVDDYTLAIAEEMLRGNHNSVSDLAKVFGVSREALNRKIFDSCRKYPKLAVIFRGCLHRCARLARVDRLSEVKGRKNHERGKKGKCQQMLIPLLLPEI